MASQGPLLAAEYDVISSIAGYGVREAGVIGALTDAQVVAATSADDLVTDLDSPPGTVHAEYDFLVLNAQRSLQLGKALGDFTDARVAAATTVEGLAEDTNAGDETGALDHVGPTII